MRCIIDSTIPGSLRVDKRVSVAGADDERALSAGGAGRRPARRSLGGAVEPRAERGRGAGALLHAARTGRRSGAPAGSADVTAWRSSTSGSAWRRTWPGAQPPAGLGARSRPCRCRRRGFERLYQGTALLAGLAARRRATQEISSDVDDGGAMMLDDLGAIERVDQHDTRRVLTEFPEHCRRALALQPVPMPSPASAARRRGRHGRLGGGRRPGRHLRRRHARRADPGASRLRFAGLRRARGARRRARRTPARPPRCSPPWRSRSRGASPVVAVTAGGALGALAQARGLPCVTLPAGLMPRMALGLSRLPGAHGAGRLPVPPRPAPPTSKTR